MWSSLIALFQEYMGTGLVLIWYLMALVYLLLREEDRTRRCLLVYTPLVILLVFFNPFVMGLMSRYGDSETYYRILWLLPVSLTLAYSLVKFGGQLKGRMKGAFFGGTLAVVILAGRLIYLDPFFAPAENLYHVPEAVVDICDTIVIPGREVMAVFPDELLSYVRQYTSLVCMPYGRDHIVDRWAWTANTELHTLMQEEEISGEELGALAAEAGCHYIILSEDRVLAGDVTDYERYCEMDGYVLYRSLTANFEDHF